MERSNDNTNDRLVIELILDKKKKKKIFWSTVYYNDDYIISILNNQHLVKILLENAKYIWPYWNN